MIGRTLVQMRLIYLYRAAYVATSEDNKLSTYVPLRKEENTSRKTVPQ